MTTSPRSVVPAAIAPIGPFSRLAALALMVGVWPCIGYAQPIEMAAAAHKVLLTTRFRTPLTYQAAMARLDEYYDQEVGRKSAAAFPRIAPDRHFELWHDMWVAFDSGAGDSGMSVTIKRPADSVTTRLVKGWMLGLAGRLDAPVPLEFKEEPALHTVEGDVYASTRDLAAVLQPDASMKALPTWQHAGLIVSANPLVSIALAPAGLHGVHRVTVTAESDAAAKLLWTRILRGVLGPGIYSVYSEDAEIEEEIRNAAQGKVDALGVTSSQAIYIPQMDPKLIETKIRAAPEMSNRMLAAKGQYDIRFRIGEAYRKVVVSWAELTAYSRPDGTFQGERPLGKSTLAAPRMPAQSGSLLVARARLENLNPGAYRVTLEGESPTGELLKIDERTYWFDGRRFEEL